MPWKRQYSLDLNVCVRVYFFHHFYIYYTADRTYSFLLRNREIQRSLEILHFHLTAGSSSLYFHMYFLQPLLLKKKINLLQMFCILAVNHQLLNFCVMDKPHMPLTWYFSLLVTVACEASQRICKWQYH